MKRHVALLAFLVLSGCVLEGQEAEEFIAAQASDLRANASYGHALVKWNALTSRYELDGTRKRGTIALSTLGAGTSVVTARVRFSGADLANPTNLGNFQVVAYGPGNVRCQLANVRGQRTAPIYSEADVRCFAPTAATTTTQTDFLITFTRSSSAHAQAPNSAYALVPAAGVLQPGPNGVTWNYTKSNGLIVTNHVQTGQYEFEFVGVHPIDFILDEGVYFATAINSANRACAISYHTHVANVRGTVLCHDATGTRADTAFSLYYANEHTPSGRGQYERTSSPTPTWFPEWDPADDYTSSADAPNGKVQQDLLTGMRTVLTGFDVDARASAMLTAESHEGVYCKVAGINSYLRFVGLTPRTSMKLDVNCYDTTGAIHGTSVFEMLFVP